MKPINYSKPLTIPALLLLPYRVDPWYQLLKSFFALAKTFLAPAAVTATAVFIDNAVLFAHGKAELSSLVVPILLLTLNFFIEPISEFLMTILTPFHAEIEWEKTEYPLSRRAASLAMKDLENEELRSEIGIYTDGYTAFALGEDILRFVLRIISIVSYFIIIGRYLPWLALAAFIVAIPMCLFSFSDEKDAYQNERNRHRRKAYNKKFRQYLSGRSSACERCAFGYSGFVTEKYISSLDEVFRDRVKVYVTREKRKFIADLCQYAMCFIAVFMIITPMIKGELTIGVFTSVVQAIFAAIPMTIRELQFDTYFIFAQKRDFAQFNRFLSLSADENISSAPAATAPAFEKIEFKNVSFSYPGMDKKVLTNVNLVIKAGQKAALVGENGSGKTTLTKLILGYYDDYEGEILVNGVELRQWDKSELKAMFTALTQNFSKYDLTVEDNIKLGLDVADEKVDEAISLSGLSDTVKKLPKGKKTMLGMLYDDGVDLSGGEWQRVAMARAIVRSAGLKILDEPTASLDPMAERDFYEQFDKISRSCATILISHRLASTRTAEIVYVLENGRIVESGSYSELMKNNGLYARMFESQRGWYV